MKKSPSLSRSLTKLAELEMGIKFCFAVLLLANALIAYAPFSYSTKLMLILLGVLLPVVLFARGSDAKDREGKKAEFHFPKLSGWILTCFLAAGIFLRFFKLTTFHAWLGGDEALEGYFALELIKKWSWQFFYLTGQHPPLLVWMLVPFFKFFHSPFFNIWFPPALFSTLTLLVSYPTARYFFEKELSWLFTVLMAFGFWPLLSGRWCIQGSLVPFFTIVCFLSLGSYLKEEPGPSKKWKALGLGVWLGLGSFTYTSWLVVIVAFFLLMAFDTYAKPKARAACFGFFAIGFLAAFSPWLTAAIREKFGGYLVGVSMASGFFTWGEQFSTAFSSLTTLFWGPMGVSADYGPTWGGLLNPLLSSCFFLGAVCLFYTRPPYLFRSMALMFFLFLAPSVFSADHVQAYRMIQVLPILFITVAIGLQRLTASIARQRRILFLGIFIVLSSGLDLYHLWKPRLEGGLFHWKLNAYSGDESQRVYEVLKPVADHRGPGLVFTEFLLLARDHTLRVAAYPFNALDNPDLQPDQATWAGIITNIHYGYFLKKRFPKSQWYSVPVGAQGDGGLAVGILPIDAEDRGVLGEWTKAHEFIHRLGVDSENMMNNREMYRLVVSRLPGEYGYTQGDPFLESVFSEWFAQYNYGDGLKQNIACLKRGLTKGYPTANLYFKLGGLYYWNHEPEEAKKAYLMAVKSKPNYTNAGQELSNVWGIK